MQDILQTKAESKKVYHVGGENTNRRLRKSDYSGK